MRDNSPRTNRNYRSYRSYRELGKRTSNKIPGTFGTLVVPMNNKNNEKLAET